MQSDFWPEVDSHKIIYLSRPLAESQQYEQLTINRLAAEVARVQKKTYTNWINGYLKPVISFENIIIIFSAIWK